MELESKWFFVIMVSILLLLIASLFLFSPISKKLAPIQTQTELEECNTLINNGPDKINMLFFSEKQGAETYMNTLFESEPLNTYKDQFNVFYINDPAIISSECGLYKGIALLCYSKDLIKKAGSCPNDFIVVLKEEDSKIRASSYVNVMSLNTLLPKTVFAHELGHGLANLGEEYEPTKLSKGQPNCKQACEDFDSPIDGCFLGCSRSDYFRSVENGVMRTLRSNYYGIFNGKIISQILSETIEENQNKITGKAIGDIEGTSCLDEQYYLIQFQDDKISDKSLEIGCAPRNIGAGPFTYKVTKDDETLAEGKFSDLIFTDREGETQIQGEVYESDVPITLAIPKEPEAEELNIFNPIGQEIAQISLMELGAEPCRIN